MFKFIFGILLSALIVLGADNTTIVPGATQFRFYLSNYPYAGISTMPALTLRLATDLDRLFYSNAAGTKFKVLTDASTSSNTPQYQAFFADATGAASSASAYTYTNGNLHAPWFTGDSVVVIGKVNGSIGNFTTLSATRLTGSDVEVSDSVKAVSGAYTGRVTGSDIDVSDTVKGVTGAFTGAVTGTTLNTGNGANELYPMNQGVRTTDDVTFDSAATTVLLSTRVRTPLLLSDSIDNSGGISTPRLKVTDLLKILPTGALYNEGIRISPSIGNGYSLISFGTDPDFSSGRIVGQWAIGRGNASTGADYPYKFFIEYNDNRFLLIDTFGATTFKEGINATDVRASDSVAGNGVYSNYIVEIDSGGIYTGPTAVNHQWLLSGHAVAYNNGPNQFRIDGPRTGAALRIDSSGIDSTLVIANDTVKVKNLSGTTATIGGKPVVTDSTGSFNVNLYGFSSSPISATYYFTKRGNIVTLRSNIGISTTSNASDFYFTGLPASITPSVTQLWASLPGACFSNNSSTLTGGVSARILNTGEVQFVRDGSSSWTSANNKGYSTFTFTYTLQ